jgi:hypothetical protein
VPHPAQLLLARGTTVILLALGRRAGAAPDPEKYDREWDNVENAIASVVSTRGKKIREQLDVVAPGAVATMFQGLLCVNECSRGIRQQ